MQLFEGQTTIDLSRKPAVLLDRQDAAAVAANYQSLIHLAE
jgi:hypothetical protein